MSDENGSWLADRYDLADPVYEPAEDSQLLADAATDHAHGTVVEVGTGSGWVAEQIRASDRVSRVVGSDINPHACRAAVDRDIEAVRADLVAAFTTDAIDTVVFNPPYLPTDDDAGVDDWQERALAGGTSGRAVIEPFLSAVGRVVAPGGCVLLVVSSLAGFGAVVERAVDEGFRAETVREQSFPFETLSVLELTPR